MKLSIVTLSAVIVLAATGTHTSRANAATSAANATGFCQSALPVFDTQIRKRPLGINNEGSSNAFISCSIPIGFRPVSVDNGVIFMTNRNAAPVDVSCTLVDGVVADVGIPGLPAYYPQTITLAAGMPAIMIWDPADFGLTTFSVYQNYSCNLPAGVEINLVGNDYSDTPPAP